MADLVDVMDAMEALALATCYPQGTSAPSISGKPIDVAQGWPDAVDLNPMLQAGESAVSIYAVPSSTSKLPVPLSGSSDGFVAAPVHGMAATASDTGFVLAGAPVPGEYATAIVNGKAYSAVAAVGDTVQSVAAFLTAAIAADLPGTSWAAAQGGAGITVPGANSIVVRIGAPATMGNIVDRQRQNIMLGVWAPNPSDRAVIGRSLKLMVAQKLTVTMPDTSQSIWIGQAENLIDKYQNELVWRRDLTVQCQWDTVETYPAYEVTAVNVTLTPTGIAPPIPAAATSRPSSLSRAF